MTKTYQQIQKQIESLRAEAELLRAKEAKEVIDRIRGAIQAYGLTARDLGFEGGRKGAAGKKPVTPAVAVKRKARVRKVAVKFRDEAGNTWAGRGTRPKWLRAALESGKTLQDFAV